MSVVKVGLPTVLEVLWNKTALDTPAFSAHMQIWTWHREPPEESLGFALITNV